MRAAGRARKGAWRERLRVSETTAGRRDGSAQIVPGAGCSTALRSGARRKGGGISSSPQLFRPKLGPSIAILVVKASRQPGDTRGPNTKKGPGAGRTTLTALNTETVTSGQLTPIQAIHNPTPRMDALKICGLSPGRLFSAARPINVRSKSRHAMNNFGSDIPLFGGGERA